jgi:HEAT repeat protein
MRLRMGRRLLCFVSFLLFAGSINAQEKKELSIDGKSVIEWIAQLKSADKRDVAIAARTIVLKIGAPAVRPLVAALEASNDDKFRRNGFEVIERLRSRAGDAVPYLTKLLKSKNMDERAEAAYLLGGIGPAAKSATSDLLEGLKEKHVLLRQACAVSLGTVGADPKVVVGPITNALKDENGRVRQSAAEGLYFIGPPAKAAMPALREALKDSDFGVRRAAQTALKRIDPNTPVDDIAPFNQPPPKQASIAPPKFCKFVGYDKAKNVVTLHELRNEEVPIFEGEKIVKENGKEKKVPNVRFETRTVEALRQFPADELKFFDAEGKPLEKQAALDRMAQVGMVLLSADGEIVNRIYLSVLNRETVTIVPPLRHK